ncbi:squalene--hopene cyclase [Thermostilla marina]
MQTLTGDRAKDADVAYRLFADRSMPAGSEFRNSLHKAVWRTRRWFLGCQAQEGYWQAELEGDSILQSETILLLAYFGKEGTPLARKLAAHLIETQLPEGGWAMYPGGKLEISGSVKAYFALKLTGYDPSEEPMVRARNAIMAAGGADRVNSFTRFYLALLGQIPYSICPSVPPEIMYLPKWFPVNLYAMSSWSRTMVVPLSIISARKPVRELPPERGIRELFLAPPERWPANRKPGSPERPPFLSWDRFFRLVDRTFKLFERMRLLPFRERAVRAAERWMLAHFEGSDGMGAIYPPIVWSMIALDALGYDWDSPEMEYNRKQLLDLVIEDDESARVQPCLSPVWDTAIAVRALSHGGLDLDCAALRRAVTWLLDKQIRRPGDWSETVSAEPGGWCFEHHNDFYPDCDDTAMVLLAMQDQYRRENPLKAAVPPDYAVTDDRTDSPNDAAPDKESVLERMPEAVERGMQWLLAMQNRDGGWGAFDCNNNREFLCHIPFADHNAMIDPSTPDLTGRVVEALGALGLTCEHPAVAKAVAYLRQTQEADGSWYGRWGVNYIYGTWQVLTGLTAVGVPHHDRAVVLGAQWLLAHQNSDGGWGESADSYDDPSLRGRGPSTASQTAWAVLGLIAAGLADHPATVRGVRFLLDRQNADGSWSETEFTGTGFPRVFYLKYHMYPVYFPMLALARFAVSAGSFLRDEIRPALRVVRPERNESEPGVLESA